MTAVRVSSSRGAIAVHRTRATMRTHRPRREQCMAKPASRISYCLAVAATIAVLSLGSPAQSAEYTLMPSPQTVHVGHFAANVKPVLTINSGDIVTIETAAAMEPAAIDESGVVPPAAVPQYVRDIYRDVKDRGPGPHILTGPVAINGAMPGDVLEVRILDISLAVDYGYNRQRPFTGALPEEFAAMWQRIIRINRRAKTAEVARG